MEHPFRSTRVGRLTTSQYPFVVCVTIVGRLQRLFKEVLKDVLEHHRWRREYIK